MNRCPKIEYARLSGEIGWNGVNSRVISSRKPILEIRIPEFRHPRPGGRAEEIMPRVEPRYGREMPGGSERRNRFALQGGEGISLRCIKPR